MRLTIVAATGGIGRHLLDQAMVAGHDVTAVVRNPKTMPRKAAGALGPLAGLGGPLIGVGASAGLVLFFGGAIVTYSLALRLASW